MKKQARNQHLALPQAQRTVPGGSGGTNAQRTRTRSGPSWPLRVRKEGSAPPAPLACAGTASRARLMLRTGAIAGSEPFAFAWPLLLTRALFRCGRRRGLGICRHDTANHEYQRCCCDSESVHLSRSPFRPHGREGRLDSKEFASILNQLAATTRKSCASQCARCRADQTLAESVASPYSFSRY